jgi:uncharacterized protein YPO0396
MTEGLFSAVSLPADAQAGYRLHRLEVFNWGTFDQRVWQLEPLGDTALLTGDIGSGKSTLVDAITTLLLPANRISYNKAAGADSKERTLRSYVEGHYKSERIESSGATRSVGLRDKGKTYSVILGVFRNGGYDEAVTLAQVFHQRDRSGQPDRFFVTAGKELSIAADFTDFGTDLNDLRRRLRAGGHEVSTTFPDYGRSARRLLGIRSEQAMELFHQTVSMKSVGNLNEFVRNHMLEPVDATERIKGIVAHFEDLTKAHDAVRRAREQLELLGPLVGTSNRYDEALDRRQAAERQRDAVGLFIAELRIRLLDQEIADARARHDDAETTVVTTRQRLAQLGRQRDDLVAERAVAGGDRVASLEREAQTARVEAAGRRERRADLDRSVSAAGLTTIHDASSFASLAAQVTDESIIVERDLIAIEPQLEETIGRRKDIDRDVTEVRSELASLAGRTSNIPAAQLTIREQLVAELGIDSEDLPFAGELLDVADEHADWRGAAERVLRGFALSLLVPQRHYHRVAGWVNDHRLTHRRSDGRTVGSRLVYERVSQRRVRLQRQVAVGVLLLADTIEVADGPFADYLRDELIRRADYRCVEEMESFREEDRAVTREGQVRSGDRHEKDDRSRVDDPRSWALGWVNERKIDALQQQLVSMQANLAATNERYEQLKADRDRLGDRRSALASMGQFRSWTDVDWVEAEQRAQQAESERDRLISGSSALAEIERRLAENARRSSELHTELERCNGEMQVCRERIDRAGRTRSTDQRLVEGAAADVLEAARSSYELLRSRLGRSVPDVPEDCAGAELGLTRELQGTIERIGREIGGYITNLVTAMGEVRRRWPEATTEMDVSVEARAEYRAFHDRVAGDDLPKFEEEFKRQLNTNAIQELAQFNNWLRRQSDEIGSRVARINEALGAIDYSHGRYIALETERTVAQEIQDFRTELRMATDDSLSAEDDHYSEQRFTDVRRIIERFRGRDGHVDTDRAWTRRVTDVRNWFSFSASERDRESGQEREHYRDSDGKSGGQKEKLAYTILAASLAYQFGLEWGVSRSRDFRFAVIDEAFGRGSDSSTRYALELFARLGLQLLIVTPLQKVHIIAPYVQAIGFVDNPEGNYSRLQTLTIEEFRDRQTGREP